MRSIRINLLKQLIVPLLLVNLIGAGLTYWMSWMPAQRAFDQSLADAAWALIPHLKKDNENLAINLSLDAEEILRLDHFDSVFFVVRDWKGGTIAGDGDFPVLRTPSQMDTPYPYYGRMRNERVRIVTLSTAVGADRILVGVAETVRKRTEIRSSLLLLLLMREGIIAMLSIYIIWLAVAKGLFPLQQMQATLDKRHQDNLSSIPDANMPAELQPVLAALNGLLEKLKDAVAERQDFFADVAHQLRTPLAALKLHLEWLQQPVGSEEERRDSIMYMATSVDRMIRQTNQLLILTRAEPTRFEKVRLKRMRLDKTVEEAIQQFVEEADKKEIDIGFNLEPVIVMGDRFLLRDMIDNLIDNAIRYTPVKGRVTVNCRIEGGRGVFSVEDTGNGIPEFEREKIFQRFYRLNSEETGSGLGLAIVKDIARDHSATVSVMPNNGKGTIFSVFFFALK